MYANEIGKKDGPLRHVDDNSSQYPHLNGFVAFDMEHWWAERYISQMINEKPDKNINIKDSEDKKFLNHLKHEIQSIDKTGEILTNKSNNINLPSSYSSAILAAAAAAAVSTTAYNKKPSSPPPLQTLQQSLNNFQLCFS
jgi:hypothetical protein